MKLTGTYRKLVRDTTINDLTLLSTDYLNHYNELVMMLEMVGDMPDMLAEVEAWAPKSYQEHFRDSAFKHKDLAIWAYEHAPDEYRQPLDDCIARMDAAVAEALPRLETLAEAGDHDQLRVETEMVTARMRARIDAMSALINGAMDASDYARELDSETHKDYGETVMGQSAIDALFD